MKICNACGKPRQGGIWIGTAMLCFCCAGDYLLRDVPEDLMAATNHKALDEGVSARELVLKALHTYLA